MNTRKTFAELESEINQRNHSGIDDFDGLTPFQMYSILYNPLGNGCIVEINQMKEDDYLRVPLIRLMMIIIDEIDPEKGMKLTAVGNIPPKIVKKIYEKSEYPDEAIESRIIKINKEDDCEAVVTARELLINCGIIKVRNKTITRTKKCNEIIEDKNECLKHIWDVFYKQFNVCYFDGYPENECGKIGYAYVLYLLDKYGSQKQTEEFYGKLYLKAFPFILEMFDGKNRAKEDEAIHCMSVRMFTRFFQYFGIISIEDRYGFKATTIKTTSLFKKMIKIHGT